MRAVSGLAVAALLLLAQAACRRSNEAAPPAAAAGQPARLASIVHLGDPKMAGQLESGFYDIEGGAWRWTGKQFTVQLATPYGAAARGATLDLKLTIPPVVIEKSKSVQIAAAVNGSALPPETYTKPGGYVYRQDVPAALLAGDAVKVTFTLDKTIQGGGGDLRDLGVVASSVGLQARP